MTSRFDAQAVAAALHGEAWRVEVVPTVASTHAVIRAAALAGAAEGTLLLAEEQTVGRGRLDRTWSAPPGTAILTSFVWRPAEVPAATWGWLPLLVGLAVADGCAEAVGIPHAVEWPNDVLAQPVAGTGRAGKVAGVLVERIDTRSGAAAVVGFGINVHQGADELPVPTATSLRLAGASEADRLAVLTAVLGELTGRYAAWRGAGGDADRCGLAADVRRRSATLGRPVVVHLPGDATVTGRAERIDAHGRLVVADADGRHVVGAGDVVHLR